VPASEKRLRDYERRQQEQLLTWTIQVRLPPTVASHAGRYMAKVLKALLRRYGVRCLALRDALPSERVQT
jgi:hypothetical protein